MIKTATPRKTAAAGKKKSAVSGVSRNQAVIRNRVALEAQVDASPEPQPVQETAVKTFRRGKLQTTFVSFCQAVLADPSRSPVSPQFLSTPIDFIDNVEFRSTRSEAEILGDCLFGTKDGERNSRPTKLPDLPVYLARLCETKLLKPDEERELFQRMNYLRYRAEKLRQSLAGIKAKPADVQRCIGLAKAADWYRDAIVKANMRLVISIVKKFVNPNNNFDDLLSDGIVALIRAVDKFDFDRGFRFSTYATQVVRRNAYRNVMQKQKERLQVTTSVHEPGVDISDEVREPTMSEARWHLLRSRLSTMLDHLDRREKLIIRARFSLGSHRNVKTLQRLADRLGVSKERVRQLEKRSLEKLRGMVAVEPVDGSEEAID
jgi:RNA polymerase sigma factor (sigma-70 family)